MLPRCLGRGSQQAGHNFQLYRNSNKSLRKRVVDFARDVLGLTKAHSTEFNSESPDPVISMMDEQKNVVKMGGTMRLGASVCHLVPGTKIQQAYGSDRATERHRHRYEFNNDYREKSRSTA